MTNIIAERVEQLRRVMNASVLQPSFSQALTRITASMCQHDGRDENGFRASTGRRARLW